MNRLVLLCLFSILLLHATGCRKPQSDFAEFNRQILQRLDLDENEVPSTQISLHKTKLWLASWVLHLADDKEAQDLIAQLQRVDVAIYNQEDSEQNPLITVDRDFRHWLERQKYAQVVRVHDKNENVYVYFREGSDKEAKLLVLVFTRDKWLVVRCNGTIDRLLARTVLQDKKNRRWIQRDSG